MCNASVCLCRYTYANNKVSAWVIRALVQPCQLGIGEVSQHTFFRSQHNRHSTYANALFHHNTPIAGVPDVDVDRGSVGQITQSALVGRDWSAVSIMQHKFWCSVVTYPLAQSYLRPNLVCPRKYQCTAEKTLDRPGEGKQQPSIRACVHQNSIYSHHSERGRLLREPFSCQC